MQKWFSCHWENEIVHIETPRETFIGKEPYQDANWIDFGDQDSNRLDYLFGIDTDLVKWGDRSKLICEKVSMKMESEGCFPYTKEHDPALLVNRYYSEYKSNNISII